MRFERLDLNLLVALDVLLTERSVSLAAERLFLSQSAASSALARLRDYFGDELLITKGRQMTLTVRAENLIEPVRAVLDQIRSTITVAQPFDPASADRQVRIMASDYTTQVLLADALAGFAGIAPGLRFELQPMGRKPVEAMDRGFADLLITIDFAVSPDHPSRFLFEDDYVVVGCRSNRALSRPLTPDAYFDLGVAFSTGSHGATCDLIEAHKWFNLAAVGGHEEAQACRAEVSEEMTAREIAEAQRRAREWIAAGNRRAA